MRMRMFDECWTRREWLDFSSATTGACEQALRWVQILFKRKRTARLFHDSELKWNGDSSMDVYRGEEPRRSRDGRVVTASDATLHNNQTMQLCSKLLKTEQKSGFIFWPAVKPQPLRKVK